MAARRFRRPYRAATDDVSFTIIINDYRFKSKNMNGLASKAFVLAVVNDNPAAEEF